MKKVLYSLLIIGMLAACSQPPAEDHDPSIGVIPQPVSLRPESGHLHLGTTVTVVAPQAAHTAARSLEDFFTTRKITTTMLTESNAPDRVALQLAPNDSLGAEGYTLTVDKNGIAVSAPTPAGLFYGVQTLQQLVSEFNEVPFVTITDYPRFAYRGLHLDVCRHMFPPEFIKRYIDLLAYHKYNRFHWHLTDDQGWRIEIKKYPKLQEVAAFRNETVIGHASTSTRDKATYDGKRYGGFYTQDEIKEIVKYAADRHVTIIPEIEMPGHALAALTAYPAIGCTGGPYQTGRTWGVFDDVYCAGKEETFAFQEGVLDEVMELFPSQYIHIGGDECPKTKWEKCPHCKKRMKENNLKDTHALQSYFIQRIEKYLNSKGRSIIGWDEILEGGLAPNATVMSWRGEEGGIAAAKENHDVIMTPVGWCYFDYYQDTAKTEPLAIGGFVPVSKVYSYEPVPPQLTPEQAKHILGAQANLWTEYITSSDYVEYMMYPRACAMAEVVWSPKESRNYNDFLQRMDAHFKRLDSRKVNSAKHIQKDIEKVPADTKKK